MVKRHFNRQNTLGSPPALFFFEEEPGVLGGGPLGEGVTEDPAGMLA